MINLSTNRARQQEQAAIDRQMKIIERQTVRKVALELQRQYLAAARQVEHGELEIFHPVNDGIENLRSILMELYKRVISVFGARVFEALEKSAMVYSHKAIQDEFQTIIDRWIVVHAAEEVVLITATRKKILKAIIKKGLDDHKSYRDIAKSISKHVTPLNTSSVMKRAWRITRTECHTVAIKSMNEAMETTRLKYMRQWVSAKDERTRGHVKRGKKKKSKFDHFHRYPRGADMETIEKDGIYVGSGEPLKFPGDPDGSAGNIINCRCVETFLTKNVAIRRTV